VSLQTGGCVAAKAPAAVGGEMDFRTHFDWGSPPFQLSETVPALELSGLSPNPFINETTIRYFLPNEGHVSIAVYDVAGRRVATLVDEVRQAGRHVASWDGLDSRRRKAASGVYFVRLRLEDREVSRKIVLTR
jgi:hypothetical protein